MRLVSSSFPFRVLAILHIPIQYTRRAHYLVRTTRKIATIALTSHGRLIFLHDAAVASRQAASHLRDAQTPCLLTRKSWTQCFARVRGVRFLLEWCTHATETL
jgi:hypothetical protein